LPVRYRYVFPVVVEAGSALEDFHGVVELWVGFRLLRVNPDEVRDCSAMSKNAVAVGME
jgi:hypothetical protein